MSNYVDPEKRARSLFIECIHLMASIIACTDQGELAELEEELKNKATTLAAISGEDPNRLIETINRLCQEQRHLIEEGMAERVQVAIIVVGVKGEEQFEEMMADLQDTARKRHAQEMDGVSRDGEPAQTGEDPERKVDPNVLEDLPTTVAN